MFAALFTATARDCCESAALRLLLHCGVVRLLHVVVLFLREYDMRCLTATEPWLIKNLDLNQDSWAAAGSMRSVTDAAPSQLGAAFWHDQFLPTVAAKSRSGHRGHPSCPFCVCFSCLSSRSEAHRLRRACAAGSWLHWMCRGIG